MYLIHSFRDSGVLLIVLLFRLGSLVGGFVGLALNPLVSIARGFFRDIHIRDVGSVCGKRLATWDRIVFGNRIRVLGILSSNSVRCHRL